MHSNKRIFAKFIEFYRYSFLSGMQIGNVGNTGNKTTGATTLMQGDYGIDFASKNWLFGKNSTFDNNGLFFLGKKTIDYQIYTGTKTTIVDFTAFARDGFWDLPLTKGVADGIGQGKEWKNSRPYAFLPRSWSISFPNPENINWK